MQVYHEPVLCEKVVDILLTNKDGTYVDGTIGGGGHAEKLCEGLSARGRLIGFDVDADAIEETERHLARFGDQVTLIRANFRQMLVELRSRGVQQISGVLLDLGVSSNQLDAMSKGFSFRSNQVLDMRMDQRQRLSALEVVNTYPESELTRILNDYGEEYKARQISRAIVKARPIETTGALSAVVKKCIGGRYLTKSLARVFQAVRVEVNGELSALQEALETIPELLCPGGRCVVIAYHSLEDRIVKQYFRQEAAARLPSRNKLLPDQPKTPTLEILTRRPLTPSAAEIGRNPRARSAKLRAVMRCYE